MLAGPGYPAALLALVRSLLWMLRLLCLEWRVKGGGHGQGRCLAPMHTISSGPRHHPGRRDGGAGVGRRQARLGV